MWRWVRRWPASRGWCARRSPGAPPRRSIAPPCRCRPWQQRSRGASAQPGNCGPGDVTVVERQDLSPNNLATFMALAVNDPYVARTPSGHRGGNGRPPIADLLRARGLCQYLLANFGSFLAARSSVGEEGGGGPAAG